MPARMMSHRSLWLAPLAALALAGCQAYVDKYVEPPVEPNVLPTNYTPRILDTLRAELDDPTGIRDAYIADPVLKKVGNDMRYVVCMRFNAKDASGRYTGARERAAYYYNTQLTQIAEAPPGLCANSAYRPFPELQKLCAQLKCPS